MSVITQSILLYVVINALLLKNMFSYLVRTLNSKGIIIKYNFAFYYVMVKIKKNFLISVPTSNDYMQYNK